MEVAEFFLEQLKLPVFFRFSLPDVLCGRVFELLGALSAIEENGDVFGGVSVVVFDEKERAVKTGKVLAEGPVAVLGSDMHDGVAVLILEVEVDSLF